MTNKTIVPVSVIIPCYRCVSTIHRAIESVIVQTQKPAEVILVDDASGDETLAVLRVLELQYPDWIKVIALAENQGAASARNTGWKQASQPYLAFLDADDSWHPKKLEIQYQWMAANPNAVLSGHKSLKISAQQILPALPDHLVVTRVNKYSLLFSNRFPTRSVMLKREVPYCFVSEKRYAEDYLLWLTIVFNGQSAWFLNSTMTYSYKEDFGESGLTGDLWKTQLGVLDTYQQIYNSGFISKVFFILVSSLSLCKYLRRLIITRARLLFKRPAINMNLP